MKSDRIKELEWKLLQKLRPMALDRCCRSVLDEVSQQALDMTKSAHERYLAVYKLMLDCDKKVARAFDDQRRSTAELQLALIRSAGWITDEEFALFSEETRASIQHLL